MPRVEIHSKTDQTLIEVLENAHHVSYDLQANAAPLASFELPRNDMKWSAIAPFQEAWIYNDLSELIDVFRIAPTQERREDTGTIAKVDLEGYATALQDDFIAEEQIYTNVSVTAVLTALLAFQSVARVTLGTVDAALDKIITTRAANENVMRACWEVRNIVGGYISVDAVPGTPSQRRLNLLVDPGQDIGQRVYSGFNLRNISKVTETEQVFTKIFPLGRGEGRTQQRPSTDKLIGQPATFTFVGAGSRSTLVLADAYRRYKGWTALGAALPDGSSALDTRSRPMKIYRNAVDVTANFQQGADELTLRSTTNGYNPGAGTWTIDYVHADHLIADASVALYGTIGNAFTDMTLENSEALVRAASVYLDAVKLPRISYEVAVHDLARVFPTESFERLHLHDKINVYDPELAVTTKDRIVSVRYGDMLDPASFEVGVSNIELAATTPRDVEVRDRVRKYEGQPNGATTLLGPDSFEDNLDATHPYTRNIEIPVDAVSVLSVKMRMRTKAYRYYVSSATDAAGGGTTVSSSSGGGQIISSSSGGSQTPTSSSGGSQTPTSGASSSSTTGTDASTSTQYNTTEGNHAHNVNGANLTAHGSSGSAGASTDAQGVHNHTAGSAVSQDAFATHDHNTGVNAYNLSTHSHSITSDDGNHSHGVTSHTHGGPGDHGSHVHDTPVAGSHTHPHTHSISHSHGMTHTHTVTVAAHDHTVTVSNHSHSVTTDDHAHNVTLSNHTHGVTLTPGIVETTTPSSMEVKVDGVIASASATSLDEFDLTPYLSRNADGTIVRGLHTVMFTPNQNGRVQATIKGVVFLQSRGVIAG